MGVVGSLLAWRLASLGVDFTWHDIELPTNAWRASTGAIYPGGSTKFGPDEQCYWAWAKWAERGVYTPWVEPATYVFATKNPPHQGRYAHQRSEHDLGLASLPSYHLNAQGLVESARLAFEDLRTIGAPNAAGPDFYIITHGFGMRLGYAYWGWTRFVELEYERDAGYDTNGRPCFYFRPDKFTMAYAYPVPNTRWWYAGSSIIKQRTGAMHELEVVSKYERWKRTFEELADGAARVREAGEFRQGWRPASRDEDWMQRKDNILSLRPLWNSGIRHFPRTWAQVARVLGLPTTPTEDACLP
jgi:hypothetical protein